MPLRKAAPVFGGRFGLRYCGLEAVLATLELADVARLQLAILTSGDVELDLLVLIEGLVALDLNLRPMDEQVVSILTGDETVAFVGVEPLNFASCHFLPFFLPIRAKSAFRNPPKSNKPSALLGCALILPHIIRAT